MARELAGVRAWAYGRGAVNETSGKGQGSAGLEDEDSDSTELAEVLPDVAIAVVGLHFYLLAKSGRGERSLSSG